MGRNGRLPARRLSATAALVATILLTGCAPEMKGPSSLTIKAGDYADAFDAAIAVARDDGLVAEFLDRRAGIIETSPRHAATWIEPWDFRGQPPEQLTENTIANQRRRARFEFHPVASVPFDENPDDAPDLFAERDPQVDLTSSEDPLTLRVWVYLERSHRPGTRRSTWTRTKTSQAVIVAQEGEEQLPSVYWTPVARDEPFERRLLAAIEQRMSEQPAANNEQGAEGD